MWDDKPVGIELRPKQNRFQVIWGLHGRCRLHAEARQSKKYGYGRARAGSRGTPPKKKRGGLKLTHTEARGMAPERAGETQARMGARLPKTIEVGPQ